MRKNGMWAIVAVALLLAVIIGVKISTAQTRTVRWDPVSTYTDGTPIEAGNAVSYSGWRQDNVSKVITQFADHVAATSSTFDDSTLVKGRTYNFWLQAHLATGHRRIIVRCTRGHSLWGRRQHQRAWLFSSTPLTERGKA